MRKKESINPQNRDWQGKDKSTGSSNADAWCTECKSWYNSDSAVQVRIHKNHK